MARQKFKTKKKASVGSLVYVISTKYNISQKILALREKCPNTEFFLVLIFLYLDQKKIRIWIDFTQYNYKKNTSWIFHIEKKHGVQG